MCELLLEHRYNFILTCEYRSHSYLEKWIDEADAKLDLNERFEKHWDGKRRRTWRYRFANGVPIKDGEDALAVNGNAGGPIVLLVEDNPVNVKLAKAILREMLPAARVVEAYDGSAAVSITAAPQIDIILMDIHPSELTGIQAAQQIRRNEHENASPRVPIVALREVLKGYVLLEWFSARGAELAEASAAIGPDHGTTLTFDREALMRSISFDRASI